MRKNSITETLHRLLDREWDLYQQKRRLREVYLTKEDLHSLGINDSQIAHLVKEGILVDLQNGKYRTYLMDIAYRASDIRIKRGGTKYVLEYDLKLIKRPILRHDYVKFDEKSDTLDNFKKRLINKLNSEKDVENFLKSLTDSGISGLSIFQYDSIIKILSDSSRDVIISAPTAFGKTIIFTIPVLLEAFLQAKKGVNKTVAFFFYPRKSLGSDQMDRLIRLVYYVNRNCGVNISIGIDDGSTKRRDQLINEEEYRGIKCPIHREEPLIIKNKRVYCRKCNNYFDFIALTREDFLENPPHIVISNIWAFQYRCTRPEYWKNGYLNGELRYIVFDEIHAYRSLVAGALRYLIRIMKHSVSNKVRIIYSSATIPKLNEFFKDITGQSIRNFLFLEYDPNRYGKDDEKYELFLLVGINPFTSWETYTHELAIFLSAVNRLVDTKNLQSLVFVDSIKNIHRLYDQTLEAIKLGSPSDHFRADIPTNDPYCYWVYNPHYKVSSSNPKREEIIKKLRNEIRNRINYHYSQHPSRFEIEEKIKKGELDLVFVTSTLELGVDYQNVSIIVNAGIPFSPESIIQRIGRAGRKEDTTHLTSLSIIIVRNNPLEYFYLYKGIDSLIDIEKIPKIPVSHENNFVKLYMLLLLATIKLTKKRGIPVKGGIQSLLELLRFISVDDGSLLKTLEIEEDEWITNELANIYDIFKEIQNDTRLCDYVFRLNNLMWAYSSLRKYIDEIQDNIDALKKLLESTDIAVRDRRAINRAILDLEKRIKEMDIENLNLLDDYTVNDIGRLIADIDNLKNRIPVAIRDPYLMGLRASLSQLSTNFDNLVKTLSSYTYKGLLKRQDSVLHLNDNTEISRYIKPCSLYKKIESSRSYSVIDLLEDIVGFKFMGSDFIDKVVKVHPGHLNEEPRDEFLSNIMYRTPPFEMINIPYEKKGNRDITKIVGARHFWLPWIKDNSGIKGSIEDFTRYKDFVIPERILFKDVLILGKPIKIDLKEKNSGKPLIIKYGSSKLSERKIKGVYSLPGNIEQLYVRNELDSSYAAIKRATENHLSRLDREIRSINRWGINFRYVGYCLAGYCISTDPYDIVCPIQDKCGGCDGRELWNTKKRKIFPRIYTHLSVRNIVSDENPLLFSVDTKTPGELDREIEFVYDKISMYFPYKTGNYILREFEINPPIGYLARTSYISLSFNIDLVKLLIRRLIAQDPELENLLRFKHYLYTEARKTGSILDAVRKIDNYSREAWGSDFEDFLVKSLLHTLAHLFFLYLALERVNIDPSRMTYVVKDSSIHILENSQNDGIGIIETINQELKRKGKRKFIINFFKWANEFLNNHTERLEELQREMIKESNKIVKQAIDDPAIGGKLIGLQRNIESVNQNIESRLPLDYIDVITYRLYIIDRLRIDDELSEFLLTLITSQGKPHLCYDGCNECIIFDRGCTELFSQIYLLSKRLAMKFIEIFMKGNIKIVRENMKEVIQPLMKRAEELVIKSPFIDEYGLNLIRELCNEGKKITLIVRSSDGPGLKNLLHELGGNLKIKVDKKKFHSKIYILRRGDETIYMQGSVNLTQSSLSENEENLTISWDRSWESLYREIVES